MKSVHRQILRRISESYTLYRIDTSWQYVQCHTLSYSLRYILHLYIYIYILNVIYILSSIDECLVIWYCGACKLAPTTQSGITHMFY